MAADASQGHLLPPSGLGMLTWCFAKDSFSQSCWKLPSALQRGAQAAAEQSHPLHVGRNFGGAKLMGIFMTEFSATNFFFPFKKTRKCIVAFCLSLLQPSNAASNLFCLLSVLKW